MFAPAGAIGRERARGSLGLGDAPIVLFVGTLSWEKAPAVAVEAAALVTEAHLVVAGDGSERADLEALAQRVAPGRVTFVGTVADTTVLYAAADLLLLTSRTEATPGVLIEAGMAGLPVVAARVGAVAEIVDHEVTGLLVDSDRPADFAAALQRVLGAPELAHRLGDAAHQRCRATCEIRAVATAWEQVLGRLSRTGA